MTTYRGYDVVEENDLLVIECSCGCEECNDNQSTDLGHRECGVLPYELVHDGNVTPMFVDGTWVAVYEGELIDCVDSSTQSI